MSFSIGLVGLPNVGKSTLFQAITKKQVPIANYPFCTIDPSVGTVAVPDERMEEIAKVALSKKIVPTTIEFTDIAGLVKNAHKGEGLGNQFLAHIREVDAIAEVVRSFSDKNVTHVHNRIDPDDDIAIVNLELVMADIGTVEKRIDALSKKMHGSATPDEKKEYSTLKLAEEHLKKEKPLNTLALSDEEKDILKRANLLTVKPIIYVINSDEAQKQKSVKTDGLKVELSAKLELELSELSKNYALAFMKELEMESSGLDLLIRAGYDLLNLVTFFTAGPEETKAWTITKGETASEAAGKIHSDIAEGFIKAEIIPHKDFINAGGWQRAKEKGLVKIEGKNYVMKDGDIAYFHFNER